MNQVETGERIVLSGLDGANPLGFLAAIGVVVSLADAGVKSIRLAWKKGVSWQAELAGFKGGPEKLIELLVSELRGRPVGEEAESARALAQKAFETAATRTKKAVESLKKKGLRGVARSDAWEREVGPLKKDLERCRTEFLEKLRAAVPRPELSLGKKLVLTGAEFHAKGEELLAAEAEGRSAVALLAGFAAEAGPEDRVARTDFDLVDSSGRLAFLETARELMRLSEPARVRATLLHPWERRDERWSLRWDPAEDRRYALLDRDPTASNNKSRSEWMANLLAYRALSAFPCAVARSGPATAAWRRDEAGWFFTWPIWSELLSFDVIRSLLGSHEFGQANPSAATLHARGILAAYRCRRVENGDYVNLSPAKRVL